MDTALLYHYAGASALAPEVDAPRAHAWADRWGIGLAPTSARIAGLFLAQYRETARSGEDEVAFDGGWAQPHTVARALTTLSQVVQARFARSAAEMAAARDPIITVGDGYMRFEGFSQCAGVYARVDVTPAGLLGDIHSPGTTNVDFNPPMLAALAQLPADRLLAVQLGSESFAITPAGAAPVVERKVALPARWLKGLTQVQQFLARSHHMLDLQGPALLMLRQALPRRESLLPLHLHTRAGRPTLGPLANAGSVAVGGAHRLQLLAPLLPLAQSLQVWAHEDGQSSTWLLHLDGGVRFELTLSGDAARGFSGEGAALETLLQAVPEAWLDAFDRYGWANQRLDSVNAALDLALPAAQLQLLGERLAALGLLGWDLAGSHWYYRQLPYRPERLGRLHPRWRSAQRLIDEGRVQLDSTSDGRIVARVHSGDRTHTVVLDAQARCTCEWHSQHQGARGPCKHILAVRQLAQVPLHDWQHDPD